MKIKLLYQKFGGLLLFLVCSMNLVGQDYIKLSGTVRDAQTKEALPFCTVSFVGNESVGTTTDIDGNYILESRWGSDSLIASYVGYKSTTKFVLQNENKQVINFELEPNTETLNTVEIKAKKKRYKRKNNPAVALMKNVLAHKNENRMEGQDFYEYDKYEKLEYSLNNFKEDFFQKRKALKGFEFMSEYVDTSALNGKPFLPFYIREIASKVYYRKNPNSKKEFREGIKMTGIEEWVDDASLSAVNDVLYAEIDINNNNIYIFKQSFPSPLNDVLGTLFYRFYIVDTIQYNGHEVIDLAFMPSNKQDLGFKGNLYVTNDSTYALVKANLSFTKQINLNLVNDFQIIQEFKKQDKYWVLNKDQIVTDFSLSKKAMGIFAKRSVMYNNQQFNIEREESFYSGTDDIIDISNQHNKDITFWKNARQEKLTEQEEGIYKMIDTLKTVKPFRNVMSIISTISSGYIDNKYFDIGSIYSFIGLNDVEGFRVSFGGTTTPELFPKTQLEGYAAYGFNDKKVKFGFGMTYSFKDNFRNNPKHFFRFSYLKDNRLVGQKLDYRQDELFLFQRGNTSRMLELETYEGHYLYEFKNDLLFEITGMQQNHRPIGTLQFNYFKEDNPNEIQVLPSLKVTAIRTHIRYAPNERYTQGKNFRHPIVGRNPVFNITYEKGMKDILGGDYDYHKLEVDVFKRFYLPPFGFSDVIVEGGKIWGEGIPYYLLLQPRANQSLFTKFKYFNLMNYLEFTNDFYLAWNIRHRFKGYIFNKIPLMKKLKLREIINLKGMWGNLSDVNNPTNHPEYIQFLKNENGENETTSLQAKPYMEASVGIDNIFKVARVDLIKRLNYLGGSDIPQLFGVDGLAIRFYLGINF